MPITDTDSTVPYPSRVSTSHVQDRTRQTPHVSLLVNEKPKPSYLKSVPQRVDQVFNGMRDGKEV
jgi:hypothetical protein